MKAKLYKICVNCHYFCRIEEKDEYCSICGKELISKCKKCGENIDNPYAEYCKYCGEKFRKNETENKLYNF
jgi:RNA polymerase subunit RPABC4/transcription elongation factor Spt4